MKAKLQTQTFVACPNCGEGSHRVDHLFGRFPASFGPWNCRACTRDFRGVINAPDDVELEPVDSHTIRTFVLLELSPQKGSVYFVVEGMRFIGRGGSTDQAEHDRFFYEEHSCPTNFIRCERIIADGNTDPHGLFDYVSTIDKPKMEDDECVRLDPFWQKLFPQTAREGA